ncbi:MAG: AAA family ATPase [Candidatus Gracilibacteria bacterium]
MIQKFKITQLFGYRTAEIVFEDNIKILIGENGLGKTTVLNSLYYLLNKMYNKLSKIDFETIELTFINKQSISFSKLELESYLEYKENRKNRHFPISVLKQIERIDTTVINEQLFNLDNFSAKAEEIINKFIIDNNIRKFAPNHIMGREIFRFLTEPLSYKIFDEIDLITNELNFSILYLPTYRRVEEDLKNLGTFRKKIHHHTNRDYYEELEEDLEVTDDTLIHFGMEDVKQRVIKIENEIEKSTIAGFSKLTGEMLSQLLRGFPEVQDEIIDELDEHTVKIILHRVGENLPSNDRKNIVNLLETKKSLKEKKELVYFISKLIDIYNEHKHLDDSVKNFRDICNKYLTDKQFKYDESAVDLDLYRNNTEEKVELNKLSSGEKQIISIFSKVYLEKNNNLIVLFDEPELSLSLPWQKQLLPDIINSNKCKFLLSVTHSPFIFDNELDKYAVGMDRYISESNDE